MYESYLFHESNPALVPRLSQTLVNRVFGEPYLATTRIVALQLMTEDLYVNGRLSADAAQRVLLLEGAVSERRLSRAEALDQSVVMQAIPFVLVSLPFGSPAVREQSMNLLRSIAHALRLTNRNAHFDMKRLAPRFIIRGYELTKSFQFFINSYGPYSTVYYFVIPYLGSKGQGSDYERQFLLSADHLLAEDGL